MTEEVRSPESGKEPALNDAELALKERLLELAGKEAEVEQLREDLTNERRNRTLRHRIALPALGLMVLQVLASNAIFVWYGDTNGWDISAAAISAWMGTNVVEVVAVVLVIVNYLFPNSKPRHG